MKSSIATTPQIHVSIQANERSGLCCTTCCRGGAGTVLVGRGICATDDGDTATGIAGAEVIGVVCGFIASCCTSDSTALPFPLSTVSISVPSFWPNSSRYANLSSSGTSSSFLLPSVSPIPFTASSRSLMMSALLFPHPAHVHFPLSLAIFSLASLLHSIPPSCPFASVSMKLLIATSAVLTPQAGCHVSSWCPDMLRQISRLTSNRPVGVRNRKFGGRRGYCGGSIMRPW